jgi:hypothetical protein
MARTGDKKAFCVLEFPFLIKSGNDYFSGGTPPCSSWKVGVPPGHRLRSIGPSHSDSILHVHIEYLGTRVENAAVTIVTSHLGSFFFNKSYNRRCHRHHIRPMLILSSVSGVDAKGLRLFTLTSSTAAYHDACVRLWKWNEFIRPQSPSYWNSFRIIAMKINCGKMG